MAKILLTGYCSFPGPSRIGVQLSYIIGALVAKHDVDVLICGDGSQAHGEHLLGARILRVSLPDDENQQVEAFRRALRRQLASVPYDVVQFRDGWSGVTALEMKRKHKYATVFDVTRSPMGEPPIQDLATATELERAQQSCLRRADLILVPHEEARQYLAGVTDQSKLHIVPPGVNLDRFDWDYQTADSLPTIVYLGTIAADRGIRMLLQAMRKVASTSKAILLLAGHTSPEFERTISNLVTKLGLTGRVQILGEISHWNASEVIAKANVCVASSATELGQTPTQLYPTKLLEYMACRRAVVAPRTGTVELLIRDKHDGLLFNVGDVDDLAATLLTVLTDESLQTNVATHGYNRVREKFSASGTRRSLHRAYYWLAQQAPYRKRLGEALEDTNTVTRRDEVAEINLVPMIFDEHAESMDETAEVEMVSAPNVEGGEVTQVEANPLLRTMLPTALVDAAGTIDLGDVWQSSSSSTSDEDDEEEVDDEAGTGRLDVSKSQPTAARMSRGRTRIDDVSSQPTTVRMSPSSPDEKSIGQPTTRRTDRSSAMIDDRKKSPRKTNVPSGLVKRRTPPPLPPKINVVKKDDTAPNRKLEDLPPSSGKRS